MKDNISYDSNKNKAMVLRWYNEIMTKGRINVADEILDTEASSIGADVSVHGIEKMKQVFVAMRKNLPDLEMKVERIISEENKVAVRWTDSGTHTGGPLRGFLPTGKRIKNFGISIFTIEGGKIKTVRFCDDVYGTLVQTTPLLREVPELWQNVNLKKDNQIQHKDSVIESIKGNKGLVQNFTEFVMNGKNMVAGAELFAYDNVDQMWFFGYEPTVGCEGTISLFQIMRTAMPDLAIKNEEIVTEGDTVAFLWTGQGTSTGQFGQLPPTGLPVTVEGIIWLRIIEGKIIESTISIDRMAILSQLKAVPMRTGESAFMKDNKVIMREFFDGIWNKADYSLIEKYVSPDMVQHIPGEGNGVDGFMETVKKYHAGFTEMNLDIQDEVAEGDRVLHRWSWTCTHTGPFNGIPATGKRVTFTGMTLVRIKDGKMVEHWSNVDAVSLLIQLGVIPAPGQQ